ncbi:hypothetical protein [Xanthomonas hortorum]|uniref:Secreted protein n=1 Tax=Xanthomonas hortorum pv. pelargonii TaxID=453602 RepID=A0A6V7F406_9XANT|nr:hypothetical protein [Xanthomonas hortorum]MCE4353027.1 hypothetical protein [Xanthomonas hortorum pv. pelargonii]MCM5525770.1 hypothetical protein [Xanthomonas hortorum pv. pelargonii]MCM5538126.1 hypothetical protein [Xanthomonas hortorum pv. pelargonii]MCM5542324.1 hypothetical protein [Xanthomonas hortorum pv. pelargonii]MCM5545923.1 hypothetical protein [Xanthomonas hortorum pv. pelargonii]
MKKRWVTLRSALMAATFLASTGFGAFQVMAVDNAQPKTESCSAWACKAECPEFGSDLGQGNVCYCCG